MTIADIIILGAVQGLLEFFPVSSSTHVRLVGSWLSLDETGTMLPVGLMIGSLGAIAWYVKDELWPLDWHQITLIVISTIPTLIVGFLVKIWGIFDSYTSLTWLGLLITSGYVISTAYFGKKHSWKSLKPSSALMIGLLQAGAIFPGISRLGSTTAAGMHQGLSLVQSIRYSFIISIPVSLAALVLEMPALMRESVDSLGLLGLGACISFGVGMLAARILNKLLEKQWFHLVAIYSLALSLVVGLLKV